MKKLQSTVLMIFIISFVTTYAQDESKSKKMFFEIGGNYGISGFKGSLLNGSISPRTDYGYTLRCTYLITNFLGLGTGVEYTVYKSIASLNNYISNSISVDSENESFEYRIQASDIHEELTMQALELPFFLTIGKPLKNKTSLTGNLGLRITMPLQSTYHCTSGYIETKGYYPSYNVEFADMPKHGFKTITKADFSGDLDAEISTALFGDIGLIVPVGKLGFGFSLFGSYGLTTVLNSSDVGLMSYPDSYHSIVGSLSNKLSLIRAGARFILVLN